MKQPVQRVIQLTDPRALRALAHPTRLRLLTLLRTAGPLTATQAAAKTGESAGTCSFHFRQLARWGLCEETGTGRGRERPWRATAAATSWSDVGASPEMVEASRMFSRVVAQGCHEGLLRWLDRRADEPLAWQQAADFGDVLLHLTPEELAEIVRQVHAVVEAAAQREAGRTAPYAGARLVQLVTFSYPLDVTDPRNG